MMTLTIFCNIIFSRLEINHVIQQSTEESQTTCRPPQTPSRINPTTFKSLLETTKTSLLIPFLGSLDRSKIQINLQIKFCLMDRSLTLIILDLQIQFIEHGGNILLILHLITSSKYIFTYSCIDLGTIHILRKGNIHK